MQKSLLPQGVAVQFPLTRIEVARNGVAVITMYSATHSMTTLLDEATVDALCKQWLKNKSSIKSDIETMEHVMKSRGI